MGDKEFEEFLNNDPDDDGGESMPECQKRLLFDIIQQKMGNSTDLICSLSELATKDSNPEYAAWLKDLMNISKQSFEQLDFLMSVIIEDMNLPDHSDLI